jgi:hypothetical protein
VLGALSSTSCATPVIPTTRFTSVELVSVDSKLFTEQAWYPLTVALPATRILWGQGLQVNQIVGGSTVGLACRLATPTKLTAM